MFAKLDSAISLAFLARFDCQDRAGWLSPRRLAAWLEGQGYCGRKDPAELDARLAGAPRGATGDDGAAKAHITRALLAVLVSLVQQIKALNAQIAEQPAARRRAHLYLAAPLRHRAGRRLLAEIGDCRARFPTPDSLICVAGFAPSTRKSGKTTYVDGPAFRPRAGAMRPACRRISARRGGRRERERDPGRRASPVRHRRMA
jgi:transposase